MAERFKNRIEAAQELAHKLEDLKSLKPLVLGIPRGAVAMAHIIADQLDADLDILLVKKLAHPRQPEFAVGSVTEFGELILNPDTMASGISILDLEVQAVKESRRLREMRTVFTSGRPAVPVNGRNIILVDDGVATGTTMLAAIRCLKSQRARHIVIATPVASSQAVQWLEAEGVEVRVLYIPEYFGAVSYYYENFAQVSDAEVGEFFRVEPQQIEIQDGSKEKLQLKATLGLPQKPKALIVFAHGSGHGRRSPRNQFVAETFNRHGYATVLVDLMTPEEADDSLNQFNVELLATRLHAVIRWASLQPRLQNVPLGLFGTHTGAAAVLAAASMPGPTISAIVSRAGRPDLAREYLGQVPAPTLMFVGEDDHVLQHLHQQIFSDLRCERKLEVIPGVSHQFADPGAMAQMAEESILWFDRHFRDSSLYPEFKYQNPHLSPQGARP